MKNKLVIIRGVPFEIVEVYLQSISTCLYNGEDAIFPQDCYEEVLNHPQTIDLMSEDDIEFNVELVEY